VFEGVNQLMLILIPPCHSAADAAYPACNLNIDLYKALLARCCLKESGDQVHCRDLIKGLFVFNAVLPLLL
jgi:hypothetical protein